MDPQLTVFNISVMLDDAGVVVSGQGTPDGATVTVEVKIDGDGSGNANTNIANGQWRVTVGVGAHAGNTGTATVKVTDPPEFEGAAIGISLFTL